MLNVCVLVVVVLFPFANPVLAQTDTEYPPVEIGGSVHGFVTEGSDAPSFLAGPRISVKVAGIDLLEDRRDCYHEGSARESASCRGSSVGRAQH
jgi:hypothetical protein